MRWGKGGGISGVTFMEILLGFAAGLFALWALLIFPIWGWAKIKGLMAETESLRAKLRSLEQAMRALPTETGVKQAEVKVSAAQKAEGEFKPAVSHEGAKEAKTEPVKMELPPVELPPLPVMEMKRESQAVVPPVLPKAEAKASEPVVTPPQLPPLPPRPVYVAPKNPEPSFNWEQFMGAKLFAWLGGLAMFLGVAYFVKYSFEHNLVPPEVRVAGAFLFSLALVGGGLWVRRKKLDITAHTLCGSGIVSLYAVTFGCNRMLGYEALPGAALFGLMALITAVAFLLAVRMDGRAIAVLGMLGGFLTPPLLSTGQDNPLGLFTYLALLDLGLLAVALHRRWNFLVWMGALGTAVMQAGWASKYIATNDPLVAMTVCVGFPVLFLIGHLWALRRGEGSGEGRLSVAGLVAVAFVFAGYFAMETQVGLEPLKLWGFVFLVDAVLLVLAWYDARAAKLQIGGGVTVFGLLALWTSQRLDAALLPWALGAYLVFAALHAVAPLVLARRHPATSGRGLGQLFPPLALLLVIGPVLAKDFVSFAVWPVILLIDVLAIGLAWAVGSLAAVVAVLILTLIAAGMWVFKIPVEAGMTLGLLAVVGGFAVFFSGASLWLARKFAGTDENADVGRFLPGMATVLPFLLLVMAVARLHIGEPSEVYGLALLLVVLTLGLAKLLKQEWLPLCALIGVLAVEYAWRGSGYLNGLSHEVYGSTNLERWRAIALSGVCWAVGFHAVFAAFPFMFRTVFGAMRGPWIAAAASGVLTFPLVYGLVADTWPNDFMGVLPVLFAVPAIVSLVLVLKWEEQAPERRLGRLALFGGVALLFITLVFPIQFSRQWITLGWALEGAALVWLFGRVPHRGLLWTGLGLLLVAFARLGLNSEVLRYHVAEETKILNWMLYTYGVAAACLLYAAKAWPKDGGAVFGLSKVPGVLQTLAMVLIFILLNLQIADFFSEPGDWVRVHVMTSALAQGMTYTIAWALFALGLLVAGVMRGEKLARYAALGLLGVALLKLFLHDLSTLHNLYRVGALIVVAAIAFGASFVYQRFVPSDEKKTADGADERR